MPTSVQDLAEKLVVNLNALSLTLPYTAEVTRRPLDTIGTLEDAVKVYAVPSARETLVETRAKNQDTYLIELGVLTRVTDGRTEDDIFQLLDELWNHFKRLHIPNPVDIEYYWMSMNQNFIYDYTDLDENYVIKSVFLLSYKVWK